MYWCIKDNTARCGLFNCIVSGGIFERGKKYPYFIANGKTYIFLVSIGFPSQTLFYATDCYDDGTYKLIGTLDEKENATFVKECEPNVKL